MVIILLAPQKKIPLAYKNTMDTIDFFLIP